jgi:hypothetical protein
MARNKADFETARKIALSLDGAEEASSWRAPAFKVRGKMFACVPTNRSAEPASIGIRIDFERRAELVAEAPDVYYVPEHYRDYPMVLARLEKIDADALRGLLIGAHRLVNTRPTPRPSTKRPTKRRQ